LFLALSKNLKEAGTTKLYSYHSEAVINLLRSLLNDEVKPPTHRQLSYARTISSVLGVILTHTVLTSGKGCGDFLEKYSEKYQNFKAQNKQLYKNNKVYISQARKIYKWTQVSQLMIEGLSKEGAAELFNVQEATIDKYIEGLNKWCLVALKDNTYDIVMILIDALEDNEDLIKYAYVDLEELIKGNKND
jgi:hypothetical protein